MISTLRVARVVDATTVEGPGTRTAVWVQGCSIRCAGCINPHLFDASGGHLVSVESIVARAAAAGAEGLTLLGGEPFDQPRAAGALATAAQSAGMGVITFTGYEHLDLVHRASMRELLGATDLLVDGPYRAGQVPGRGV